MTRLNTSTPATAETASPSDVPRPRPGARAASRSVGVLLALAVVATAGAPSVVRIRSGDTLWDLAREHGTSVSALRRLNDLPGNGQILAGSTLRVGTGSAASAGNGERRHTVRPGDTLSEVALRYDVSQSSLRLRNGLTGSTIQIGRRLVIPSGGGGVSSVPTTNAGVRISDRVRRSVAQNRATLADRRHPSKTAVRRMVAATARRHGVSPSLAVAVAFHESGFQQRVVSPVNAIGVMQVLPSTARVLSRQTGRSLNLLDTQDNITAGVLLLRQLIRSTGSRDGALAGYYQGLGSISRRGILPQTRSYLRSIDILRQRFAGV